LIKDGIILICSSSKNESGIQSQFPTQAGVYSLVATYLHNEVRSGGVEEFINQEVDMRTAVNPLNYVRAVLQLDAILPTHAKIAVTAAGFSHILEDFLRDLPEAFDQALSRTTNRPYGNKVFQIIAVRERLFTLDKLQVALTIVPTDLSR
jgi:hypothetical protein